jgi:arylsulfatase A-like enzyme
MKLFLPLCLIVLLSPVVAAGKPNILWLTSEDHGPHMGCYGDKVARTPNVDALAAKGMTYRRAWSVAPVCAPARTALISGLYPSSSGGLHMRSMVSLPEGFRMYPQFLREAGYYCTNNSKTDYNLREPGQVWDESSGQAHWRKRAQGQPFFAIFNSTKSHESQIRTRPHVAITRPEDVRVPAYHPDTPEVRQDWAQYYDKVSEADADAGRRLRELEEAGLADDTIVFYYADHGSGMPRNKRWPSNGGLQVPFVVFFPEKWKHLAPKDYQAGGVSERLISFVDLAPTVLSLAGIEPPNWLQGRAFAGSYQAEPPEYVFGERGRMDERLDLVRSVTDGRYVYLRNYHPHVSQGQRVAYQFETPTTRVWHDLYTQGRANEAQSIFWRTPKAVEELYDLESDPDEVHNLAQSPAHQAVLEKLRAALRAHLLAVRDTGFLPERELHERAAGATPYEMAHDGAKYPLERILAVAELASNLDAAAAPELARLLREDSDSAVRYWGALGLLMRGGAAVREQAGALRAALADASSDVRLTAAQALGLHGSDADLRSALDILADLVEPKKNGVLTAVPALAAIEALGERAKPLHAVIAAMAVEGAMPDKRYQGYVARLIAHILPDAAPAMPAKRKRKK